MTTTQALSRRIPAEYVVDFDMFRDSALIEDPYKRLAEMTVKTPDFFYTPRNGGHWVAMGKSVIETVFADYQLFSPVEFHGIPRPSNPPQKRVFIPPAMNPPEHTPYRKLINPLFAPKAITALEPYIRQLCIDLIEKVLQSDHCEFVREIATPFPVQLFMRLMGLPLEDQGKFLDWANERWNRPEDPNARANSIEKVRRYLLSAIEERESNLKDDWISYLISAEIDGKKLDRENILLPMCTTLFYSGLDTVRHTLSFFMAILTERSDLQEQLYQQPSIVPDAVEELFRVRAVLMPGREITRDAEVFGVTVQKGDLVLICLSGIGFREEYIKDPSAINFTREGKRHAAMAFGLGVHRCVGAALAKRELTIFLEEWSKRIPLWRYKEGFKPDFGVGHVLSVKNLQLNW